MNTRRFQHLVPAAVVLLLAILVAGLSFTQEPASAYLFPRIISVIMLFLALWNFARAALDLAKVGEGVPMRTFINILPGLIIILVLIFGVLQWLGFYAASFVAFLVLYTLYDPAPFLNGPAFAKRLAVSVGFMVMIYGLFDRVLQVQAPTGLLF